MIDVLALREKAPKRETKHVNMLWFIQKTLWKVCLHLYIMIFIVVDICFLVCHDYNKIIVAFEPRKVTLRHVLQLALPYTVTIFSGD